jgi:hypothetical protein
VGLGKWEEALSLIGGLNARTELARLASLPLLAPIQAARGEHELIGRTLEVAVAAAGSTNTEFAPGATVAQAIALNATDRPADALAAAWALATSGADVANEDRREAYAEAGLAALAANDEGAVERLIAHVDELPPALRSPLLRAGAARFAGLLAHRRGDTKVADERLGAAVRELRAVDCPFVLAQVLVEHAEVLESQDRREDAAPLRLEAHDIFLGLKAAPWLVRARGAQAGAGV